MFFRPTHLQIDLKALKENFHFIRKSIPKQAGVIAVVKANAYGHGVVPVAKTLENLKVDCLGVATIEEGIELRQAGIRSKILVIENWGGSTEKGVQALLQYQLTPVLQSKQDLQNLQKILKKKKKTIAIHLDLDSGMSRLGVTPQEGLEVFKLLRRCPEIKLEGVMTHLAWRENRAYTDHQCKQFRQMGEALLKEGLQIPIWHVANSASVLDRSPVGLEWVPHGSRFWVRPGIMLYGVYPYESYQKKGKLKPVMSLVSQISLVKEVPAGTKVSYNCTFTTKRKSRLGLVPVGYSDGYPWVAAGKAKVLIGGRRLPVLGRITMDIIIVDLTDYPKVQLDQEVVLLGQQGKERIEAEEIAKWSGTIGYEIVTRMSARLPRVYK
ncbi:MAG: alanine racemase [Deltaproteobacteria bacterium]|nr:alanine racemase [Deltaproteobacteria bacterium]